MAKYKFFDNEEQHLHTLDLSPLLGTSTVLEVLAKPLTWWASGMAVKELGWINSKEKGVDIPLDARISAVTKSLEEIKGYTPEQWLKRLDKAYRAHKDNLNKAAKDGTDLHAELERYVKFKMGKEIEYKKDGFDIKIQPFIDWAETNVEKFLWSEAHCYSSEHWIGGITDAGAQLKTGEWVIIDFKSSKEAYNNQFYQIAGYHIQLEENGGFTSDGEQLFKLEKEISQYIVVPFGGDPVVPVIYKDLDKAKAAFLACLTLYKLENNIG